MPIRMTDDDDSSERDDDSGSGGGGGGSGDGGGGGLFAIFALIVFFFRHPKLTLVILAIGGAIYLFGGGSGGSKSTGPHTTQSGHRVGATLDQNVYDTALVHEPLADQGPRGLPEKVSLLEFAPPRRNQGHQGSCVGWATTYAARSILHARQTGLAPQTAEFSPAFTYNQIAKSDCNGSYIVRALELLQKTGALPYDQFAYTDESCSTRPSGPQKQEAAQYRIAGFDRLSVDSSDYRTNAQALKQHLAQGAPVVIGMQVGGTFETAMEGRRVWHPTSDDYDLKGDWGGHAMAVIGYDDLLEGGAFQLMNSWGDDWGENGVAWVRYKDFDHFVKEAYGLYPMGEAHAPDQEQRVRFGLVETGSQRRIPLKAQSGITFRTTSPIKKGTRFKVEFSNTRPVYTYLFGQETDGSSYVLFPYSEKHSPYCGTVGTRVFPRKQSLTADDVGTRDSVAVVISPKALDFQAINGRITSAAGQSYAEKLSAALGDQLSNQVRMRAKGDQVELTSSGQEQDKVHAMVLEFDKQ